MSNYRNLFELVALGATVMQSHDRGTLKTGRFFSDSL